jgi:hypothetical protein
VGLQKLLIFSGFFVYTINICHLKTAASEKLQLHFRKTNLIVLN